MLDASSGDEAVLATGGAARSVESMLPTTVPSVADFGQILPARLYGGLREGN